MTFRPTPRPRRRRYASCSLVLAILFPTTITGKHDGGSSESGFKSNSNKHSAGKHDGGKRDGRGKEALDAALHPSWAARRAADVGIKDYASTRVVFDD